MIVNIPMRLSTIMADLVTADSSIIASAARAATRIVIEVTNAIMVALAPVAFLETASSAVNITPIAKMAFVAVSTPDGSSSLRTAIAPASSVIEPAIATIAIPPWIECLPENAVDAIMTDIRPISLYMVLEARSRSPGEISAIVFIAWETRIKLPAIAATPIPPRRAFLPASLVASMRTPI